MNAKLTSPASERTPFFSWEEAVEILRRDPKHQKLIFDSYLTDDLVANCERFAQSAEFREILRLVKSHCPQSHAVLDIPAGNGIATYAFTKAGYAVTAVEPDPSATVGREAIRRALTACGMTPTMTDAYGESLPFDAATFDVAFVRQGLHHARELRRMLEELYRVLKPSGLLLACREHVVDDYGSSLERFLASQVDHQLYGGENAFTLADYRDAIKRAGFRLHSEILPYDSPINLHPNTPDTLRARILASLPGRVLRSVLGDEMVARLGLWKLRRSRLPGRLYSFVALKA